MKNISLLIGIIMFSSAATTAFAVSEIKIQQQIQAESQVGDNQIKVQEGGAVQGESNNQKGSEDQIQQQIQQQDQQQIGVDNENKEQNKSENKEKNQSGQTTSQMHRSAVANFVQKIQDAGNKDGGIGEQVRTIAQQQNQSETTTVQAMEKVETRSKIKIFFLGSDYRNLGTLRSEMVQTKNRLEQLKGMLKNVQNEESRVELQNQITVFEQEQLKLENFIKEHDGKFSLFGWLIKLFS